MNTDINHETEVKPRIEYLGSLGDLGLGNPDGIPSFLADASDAERVEYGEKVLEAVRPVTDFTHIGCVDGRSCVCNADQSAPEVRRRHVSGTASNLEMALNADAPVLETIDLEADLDKIVAEIDDDFAKKTGILPSAHEGGCGGANGAEEDNTAIHDKPEIMDTVAAIMNRPEVLALTGNLQYDEAIGAEVRETAGKTAIFLRGKNWNGQARVEATAEEEPSGVEELESDDSKFHGHEEGSLLLVVSSTGKTTVSKKALKELGLGQAFTYNIDVSNDWAKAQTGNRGETGLKRSFISSVAKNVATASRLASDKTPVYLVVC